MYSNFDYIKIDP